MKTQRPLSLFLRLASLLILIGGLTVWASAGARMGWTQTSIVEIQKDEITDIEYPVRRDAFVPGIEVPAAAAGVAAVLFGLSFLGRRNRTTVATHA